MRGEHTTRHYPTLHYTTFNTPPHLESGIATTLHWLHYSTSTTPPHHTYNYTRTTPNYVQQLWVRWPTRWTLQPLQPVQQTQLQQPGGPSVDSLCHPWFTASNLFYRRPILKLPSPPCAVPLVLTVACEFTSIILSVYLELLKTARSRWSQEGYIRLIRHEEEDSYCGWDNTPSHGSFWLVLWNMTFIFPWLLGMSSSQLTNS